MDIKKNKRSIGSKTIIMDETEYAQLIAKRQIILLTLLNNILIHMKKNKIENITEFVNISRSELIKKEYMDIFDSMSDTLFEVFNKQQSGYYHKSKTLICTLLKNLSLQSNYKLEKINVSETIILNGIKYKKNDTHYSIIENKNI